MGNYMQVDNVKNSVADANHDGWIELKLPNQSTKRRTFKALDTFRIGFISECLRFNGNF